MISQTRSSDFLISEITKISTSLEKLFDIMYCDTLTNDYISQLKTELPGNLKQVENIPRLIKYLLSCNKVCEMEAKIATNDYDVICDIKDKYVKFINDEVADRELNKKQLFNEGRLKITFQNLVDMNPN